ncbi:MAG: hypothetical protein Q4E53_12215 [Eubacteriales bacterium]|nr:hypothetical protein [Eubacteriales bacterium]
MITLFMVAVLVLFIKIVLLTVKMTWGITKAICFIIFLPLVLIILAFSGIMVLAVPFVVFALLGTFLIPMVKWI